MKRYISIFLINLLCFVLQTTVFQYLRLGNITPNLLLVITAASGLMYGRRLGMFSGVLGGLLVDTMFQGIIGISILIYTLIGYVNGLANKLYFKEDLFIPILSIAISDLSYGILFYGCRFLLRGRLDFPYYLVHIIMPEMIYTMLVGLVIYIFMRWLEEKMNPEERVSLEQHTSEEGEATIRH